MGESITILTSCLNKMVGLHLGQPSPERQLLKGGRVRFLLLASVTDAEELSPLCTAALTLFMAIAVSCYCQREERGKKKERV